MEFTRLIIEERRSPSNKDPSTIKYIGISFKVYEATMIETGSVFCVAKRAARIPDKTTKIRVGIHYHDNPFIESLQWEAIKTQFYLG